MKVSENMKTPSLKKFTMNWEENYTQNPESTSIPTFILKARKMASYLKTAFNCSYYSAQNNTHFPI
jgi:hypothetical protein